MCQDEQTTKTVMYGIFCFIFGALLAGGGGIWLGIHAYVPTHVDDKVPCTVHNRSYTEFTCGDTDSPNIEYKIMLSYEYPKGTKLLNPMCNLGISCKYCDRLQCEQQPVQSLACLPVYSLGSTLDETIWGKFTPNSTHTCHVYTPDPTVLSDHYDSELSLVPLVVIVPGGLLAVIVMPIYCVYRCLRRRKGQQDAAAPITW